MPDAISITRTQLAEALREWDEEAKREGWPRRLDSERFSDTADFLFEKLQKNQVS